MTKPRTKKASPPSGQPYIHLHPKDGQKKIKIETEDEDRFFLTVEAAIRACKAFGQLADFRRQFTRLLDHLSEWLKAHDDKVDVAYIAVRDAGLLFLVVQKAKRFDQDFEDSLSDLDIAVAQDAQFSIIKLSVLALPQASEQSIQSFIATPHD